MLRYITYDITYITIMLHSHKKNHVYYIAAIADLEGGAVLLGQERDLPDDRELQLRVVHLLDVVAPAMDGWMDG